MQGNIIQNQFQNIEPDSTGSIYSQSYDYLPLSNQFIKIGFINYSETKKLSKAEALKSEAHKNDSKLNFLSFQYSDFILVLLLLLFSLLAFVRLSGKKYYSRLLMSIQNYSYSVSFFKEKNLAFNLLNIILSFVFYISAGILATIISEYYGLSIPNLNKISRLFILTIVIFILVLSNRLVTRVIGSIFGHYKITCEYLFYYGNLLKIVGILFLISSLILSFTNPEYQKFLIYTVFFISIITYLVKSLRIFIIFFSNRLSLYYLILYFCALEIIPFILLTKLIVLLIRNGYSFSGIIV